MKETHTGGENRWYLSRIENLKWVGIEKKGKEEKKE